jgi:hypothetical protein
MPVVVNYPPPSSVVVNEVTGAVTVVAAGPRGVQGVQGPAATVAVGTTSTCGLRFRRDGSAGERSRLGRHRLGGGQAVARAGHRRHGV